MADVILSLTLFLLQILCRIYELQKHIFFKKIFNLLFAFAKNVKMHFEFRSSYILQFLKNNIGKIIIFKF